MHQSASVFYGFGMLERKRGLFTHLKFALFLLLKENLGVF